MARNGAHRAKPAYPSVARTDRFREGSALPSPARLAPQFLCRRAVNVPPRHRVPYPGSRSPLTFASALVFACLLVCLVAMASFSVSAPRLWRCLHRHKPGGWGQARRRPRRRAMLALADRTLPITPQLPDASISNRTSFVAGLCDSSLEGDGFEPSVPRPRRALLSGPRWLLRKSRRRRGRYCGSARFLLLGEPFHRARLGHGLSRLWLAALRGGFRLLPGQLKDTFALHRLDQQLGERPDQGINSMPRKP